jgi:ribosomal 50S subunit-recycling heat shock protein
MRLDKYLKVSRLIKRRSVAKNASLSDRILVNGKLAKPSKEVNVGDILSITFGTKVLEVKITQLVDSTKKQDALLMYELISEKTIEKES